jgi:hypothetical protein
MSTPAEPATRRSAWLDPLHVVDLFVYVVVLNLAIEFFPAVIAESFTMSLVTAAVLKAVLELVLAVKNWVKTRIKAAEAVLGKIGFGLVLWLVMIGSKFVVLELIALLFGGSVKLGGFFAVTGLVLALLLARAGVRKLLGRSVT